MQLIISKLSLEASQTECYNHAQVTRSYLFYAWGSDLADAIDVIVNVTLVVPPKTFSPQIWPL